MKIILLILLIPSIAFSQKGTFISFNFAPASTKHIFDQNEDVKSTFGGHYGIMVGKLNNNISYAGGIGLLFSGSNIGFAKATDQQVIVPFQFGFFPVETTIKPFIKVSLIPSYLINAELEGDNLGPAKDLYEENASKWNFSTEGSLGIRISLPKSIGFLDIGAGYLRALTSIQKDGEQFPQAISGIVTLTSLIK